MSENALDKFVQARAEEFLVRLREQLIGIAFEEFESKSLLEIFRACPTWSGDSTG
jgi:hypothetical protein